MSRSPRMGESDLHVVNEYFESIYNAVRGFASTSTFLALFAGLYLADPVQAAPQIQHWTTDNGTRVYFVKAPELPIVDIQVVFDGGAARDGDHPGLAVLTNGLLSEGAGALDTDQISVRFDELGARFSSSAHRDMAVVSLRSLSEPGILTPVVELLSIILTQPTFPKDAFERERKRMLIGIEQRKQSPGSLGSEAFYKAIYSGHPYAVLPGGQADSVKALTLDHISTFYDKYYVARNAIIAIVGHLDRNGAEGLATAIIGRLPEGQAAGKIAPVPALGTSENITIKYPSAQTHILMGQPGMRRGDPDYFALYVGNHILGGNGLVSRLSNEIREKRGLSYSSYSYFNPMRQEGPYTLGLQTRNDSAKEALAVLRDELKKFVTEGPSQAELVASKKNITGGFPLRISSNKKIIGYVAMIGFYGLPLDYLEQFNDHIDALTVKDIKDAFQRRIHPDKMVTVMVGG